MVTGLRFGSTLLSVTWIPLVAVLASVVTIAISRRDGVDRDSILNRVVMVWFVVSIAAVMLLTLQPGTAGFTAPRPSIFNPMPPIARRDALSNVLLYLPVGFFGALWWRGKQHPVVLMTGFALALSFTIEFAQWVLPIDRAATTQDVVFNTIGGFLGAAAATTFVRWIRRDRAGDSAASL